MSVLGWSVLAFVAGLGFGLAGQRAAARMFGGGSIASLLLIHLQVAAREVSTQQWEHSCRVTPDAWRGLEAWLAERSDNASPIGVPIISTFMSSVGIGSLLAPTSSEENYRPSAVEYDAFALADDEPLACPRHALWLCRVDGRPVAVLWTSYGEHSASGFSQRLKIEVATVNAEQTEQLGAELFDRIDRTVREARTFRGKVLSFEEDGSGGATLGVTAHRLRDVAREDVILPEETLRLLDRNVLRFVQQGPKLRDLGMPTKKGLLFYGPPGTGKTHTIHYLVGSMPEWTTLLITAEQVGALGEYTALARLLQPSLVVIEDVDLIARDRSASGVCEQSLLNRLLNEMDGLREDSDVLFFLTTNRPEELEEALASRPGRVDQAIEFPLPEAAGRRKLVRLYSRGADLSNEVADGLVRRTEGVSAAFIKELMRRSIQFHLECDPTAEQITLSQNDVDQALDELLFAGGTLNRRMLGAD